MFWLKVLAALIPSPLSAWLVDKYHVRLIVQSKATPYFPLPGYMNRWWLFRDVKLFGSTWSARIHETLRSDIDRELHDHPYDNISILLSGTYIEEVPHPTLDPIGGTRSRVLHLRRPGDIVVRRATDAHRLQVLYPAWSLFIMKVSEKREWGFWTRDGWVHWRNYVDPATLSPEEYEQWKAGEVGGKRHGQPAAGSVQQSDSRHEVGTKGGQENRREDESRLRIVGGGERRLNTPNATDRKQGDGS